MNVGGIVPHSAFDFQIGKPASLRAPLREGLDGESHHFSDLLGSKVLFHAHLGLQQLEKFASTIFGSPNPRELEAQSLLLCNRFHLGGQFGEFRVEESILASQLRDHHE